MKLIPILFSTPMVQAILDGRKTQTRRNLSDPKDGITKCPYGQPGDVLWVRETFAECETPFGDYIYKADYTTANKADLDIQKWTPSIFMPKEASRIFLKITDIRVERLQDITEANAIAEGIKPVQDFDSGNGLSGHQMYENYLPKGYTEVRPLDSFQSLWRSINGDTSWNTNPYVWAITFSLCEKPSTLIPHPSSQQQ